MQHIIIKSIYGKLTEDEQAKLNEWLQQPANEAMYRNIREHLDGDVDMVEVMGQIDVEGALDKVWSMAYTNNVSGSKPVARRFSLRRWAAAACVSGIVLIGAGWWYRDYTRVTPPEVSQEVLLAMQKCKEADRMEVVSEAQTTSTDTSKKRVATPKNKEYWLTLDDGTIVHLNNSSRINYPETFAGSTREVTLEGEAYFMVSKDKSRQFIVHTNGGDIKVYGTEFNVSTGRNTEVVLVTGSVGITTAQGAEYMIEPGQKADVSNSVKISTVDTTPYVAWNQGKFFFKEWPLEKIMSVIGKWYDRKVVFTSDAARTLQFSGNFERYDDLQPMMDAISSVTGLDINVSNERIIISK